MKKVVWKNKSNGQLCITIPKDASIKEGDLVELKKTAIKKISYSGVVADLFHYGHLSSIEFAKSKSDYNICGVITDEAVQSYRSKPIANLKERKAIISNLKCVDRVMVQKSRDPTENLRKIHEEFPDAQIILVHGSDLKYVHGTEYIKEIKGRIVKHPYYERLSNFKIINQLIESKDKVKDIVHFDSLIKGKEKIDKEYEKGNKTIISTKAETLKALKPLLKKSIIEDMYIFTVPDWKNKKQQVIKSIQKELPNEKIVVRSSAISEDTLEKSNAGAFESILNIHSGKKDQIEKAVEEVISSYEKKTAENAFNQVLVQRQSKNVVLSGVLFTRTLENGAPYYVINYDDTTGSTDSVTKGIEHKNVKVSSFAEFESIPKKIQPIIESAFELERIIPHIALDIEFAINKKGQVIIFQTRPLTAKSSSDTGDSEVKDRIDLLKKTFEDLSKTQSHLSGKTTILADMPDWNPAEIIGDCPNHLDYSLYDYIITDSAWHKARTSQGYYNVDPAKLVVLVGNKPYINVRNSFNSFVPAQVSTGTKNKLVDFFLDKLKKSPELQDKVEFEILFTCYDFHFDKRTKELKNVLSKKEISELKKAVLSLTNNLVKNSKASIGEDLNSLKQLEKNRVKVNKKAKDEEDIGKLLSYAKELLDDCNDKGTVQFSRLARLGFVAKILLKSLVSEKIISEKFYDDFMNSISTVATEISSDFSKLQEEKLSKEEFIEKYYHLRPGSYDITSSRYDMNYDLLKSSSLSSNLAVSKFNPSKKELTKISAALKKHGLSFNATSLLEFARAALESREFSKFEFTKNLSDAIEYIAKAGEEMGFSRAEIAMLDLNTLFLKKNRSALTETWKDVIVKNTKERELNSVVVLPPVITKKEDFDVIQYYTPRPNFITQKRIDKEVVKLDSVSDSIPNIKDKIVLIENGDPGYDWIFTREIAGLITKYGGVASHMSIRCAEFGIPAAIGCGILFDSVERAKSAILDCKNKKIDLK